MDKYSFKIQYCAEGDMPAEVMQEFEFDAPSPQTADVLANDI